MRLNTRYSVDEFALAESHIYMEDRIQSDNNRIVNKNKQDVKVSGMSQKAKYYDVGSDGPTTIVASQSNSELPKSTEQHLIEDVDWDDESEDIEGY